MIEFLAHILPEDGLRCATLFAGKRVTNHFFSTNAELASFIAQHDQNGHTVYHACASYKVAGKRTKPNVHRLQSLWMDIDGGPDAVKKGTGYENAHTAVYAVAEFCRRAALPRPTVVASGSGLHLYWALDRALSLEEWNRYARGLKRRAKALGLCCDPSRTSDAASILRTPGSHNRKSANPVAVQSFGQHGPYSLELFTNLLNEDEKQQTITGDTAHLAGRKTNVARLSLTDLGNNAPRYSERIADRCRQIGELRRTLGLLSEPVWYACLSVLAFTVDGDRFAHDWSVGDARYSPDETNRKLAQARKLSGATTCAHFLEINSQGCEGCPFAGKITSPISLGYEDHADKLTNSATQTIGTELNGAHTLPLLPWPYEWRDQTIVMVNGTAQGNRDTVIAKHPIFLAGVAKGEVRGDFSLSFRQHIPAEGWKLTTVSFANLFGPNGLAELRRFGANVHEPDAFKKFVTVQVDEFYKAQLGVRYDQFGMKKEGFLCGKKLYTPNGIAEAALNEELTVRSQWIGPGCGSGFDPATGLERWREAAETFFAKGCETQAVALLASFAAPLMRFIGVPDEGGAVLSFVSKESGKGKTVALAGATSVWGQKHGLGLTHDDNRITKLLTLAALGNLPLVYDEISTKDSAFIRDFIRAFTEGRDKMRADRSGQIKHSAATWQTIMLTAGNTSLVDTLSLGSEPDPMAYRIFEVQAFIPPHLMDVTEKCRKELEANCGFASEPYAAYLVQVRDLLPKLVEQALKLVGEKLNLKDPQKFRFWIRLAAVIVVAATLVRHLELLRFSVQDFIAWLLERMRERAGDNALAYAVPDNWVYKELALFIAEMKPQTLRLQGTWHKNKPMFALEVPREKILARYETGNKHFTVNVDAMKEFAQSRGFPWYSWRDTLLSKGIMFEMKRVTLTAGTEIAGGQQWCYEINLNHHLIGGDERLSSSMESNVVFASF